MGGVCVCRGGGSLRVKAVTSGRWGRGSVCLSDRCSCVALICAHVNKNGIDSQTHVEAFDIDPVRSGTVWEQGGIELIGPSAKVDYGGAQQ